MVLECNEIDSCNGCMMTNSSCVWCGVDSGCHAWLSPYGCTWTVPCTTINSCRRKIPEFVGYETNKTVLNASIGCAIASFFVATVVMCFFADYRRKSIVAREVLLENENRELDIIDDPEILIQFSANARLRVLRRNLRDFPLLRWDTSFKVGLFFYLVVVVGIVLTAYFIVVLFPISPEYYICLSSNDWTSLIKGFLHFGLRSDKEMLLSIKNTNRFDFVVLDPELWIFYEDVHLGK